MEQSPKQQLSSLLNPDQLTGANLFGEKMDMVRTAELLGGIGLGDVEAASLPTSNQNNGSERMNKRSLLDSPELQEVADSIREQLATSHQAYDQFTSAGDLPTEGMVIVQSKLDRAILEWASNGDLEYVWQQQEADPELSFDLVINTGEILSHETLYLIANAFAKDQDNWDEAYISKDFLEKYTSKELSGSPVTVSDGRPKISFSLIPTKYTIQPASVDKQVQELEQLKQNSPANLIIPSMKDAVALWYLKRQQQREASGNPDKQLDVDSYKETFIRHINLAPKRVGSVSVLPESFVYDGGQPSLNVDGVEVAVGVRVAVG